jgi:regulator of G-protein signaling
VENVKFWQACCDLKLLPLVSIPGSVKLVYDEFIDPNAPSMVNLNVIAFNEAEKDLKNPTRYAFGAAEEQIYNLMQNDIYPRFLKTDFDMMMKMAHSGSMGKSFFKKFTSRSANKLAADKTNPVEIISPCLPNRYTKRQLSISRGSSNTSGSMDNLFLDLTNWGGDTSPTSENNALVDILTSPSSEIRLTSDVSNNDRVRRVSAPLVNYQGPPGSGGGANNTGGTGENNGQLWMVAEASESEGDIEHCGVAAETEERDQLRREMLKGLGSSLVQSHSMENLKKYRNKNSNGDDDNCDLINCNKVMESGILSLRTPTEDMFDQPALIKLDRKKSNSIENLHGHDTFSPLTSLANFSPPDYCISDNTNELATIPIPPNPTYTAYSSSESIHSAISN